MNKKKILLSVVALLLVCALSVAGTMAIMKMQPAAPVENTFIAAGGGKLADAMTLTEHRVAAGENGDYYWAALNDEDQPVKVAQGEADVVTSNTYKVVPNMSLPKDPTITIVKKTDAPAYLFIEVVNDLPEAYEVNLTADWKPVEYGDDDKLLRGPNQGLVYKYDDILSTEFETDTFQILEGNHITVNNVDLDSGEHTLKIYAYLCQTSVYLNEGVTTENTTDPAFVFAACFESDLDP